MINLLPPETKRQLRAARANVLLFRYTVLLAVSVGFLAIGTISVYFVMGAIKNNAENTITDNHSQISNYTAVQAEANEFRSNLSTAKSILDNEIIYSDTVLDIARIIPSGVVLSNLSLNAESFGSPMVINASAKSYDRAIALKTSLEQSGMFSDVQFSTISGSTGEGGSSSYPYSVTINATLNKDAR